jgi:peptide methionine sulfoxide reductase MsrA
LVVIEVGTDRDSLATTCEPHYCQQYLHKNPNGYCPIHATGVKLADA